MNSQKLNVLVLGAGGREHALCWKLQQSPLLDTLYALPGNPGMENDGVRCVAGSIKDFEAVKRLVLSQRVQLVVVGSEAPLCDGIVDFFKGDLELKDIYIFGPTQSAAQLEASKQFAKDFMQRHGIPTAFYKVYTTGQENEAKSFLQTQRPPYVIKADGLAAGKGVLIESELNGAENAVHECFAGKFAEAGKRVVIEEFLEGIEFSVFAICDGEHYRILPVGKDYKRAYEGDTGLNTGGMGSVSPVPFITPELRKQLEHNIILPTLEGMRAENNPFLGFLFAGMMLTKQNDLMVIEYNVRMGDPETQVVLQALDEDLLALLLAACKHELKNGFAKKTAKSYVSVSLVSEGYPEAYQTQKVVKGLERTTPFGTIFHAGTARNAQGELITSGGRVFSVCGVADTLEAAQYQAYQLAEKVEFEGKRFRKDIGEDLKQFM